MSTDTCLAILLDGPLQSWGYSSRFERRTTALHPTRSGLLGLIAAAVGIDKYGVNEAAQLAQLEPLRVVTFTLPRRNRRSQELLIARLEDYHTVTGIRRASGKVDGDATVQTYRHYLLDARFGVLVEGPDQLIGVIEKALRDPKWGIWLGRKCCIPASPLLASPAGPRATVWAALLQRVGYTGTEPEDQFDRVVELAATDPSADMIDDAPIAFGAPIGNRHNPRWIRRVPRSGSPA